MSGDASDRRTILDRLVLLATNLWRIVVDGLVLGAWVLFLALAFLRTGYPRWAFYVLLVLGVVVHTQVTSGWRLPRDE